MPIFKKLVTFKLKMATKLLLFRLRPEVIAITGSAGKTTTKEFVATVLNEEYHVLVPKEGYNTEIGAPMALFGETVPVRLFSPAKWIAVLARVFFKALFLKNFPEKVVLEMGADKPGDIRYLVRLFKPKKAVILAVLPVHLEEFKSIEAVAAEKSELARVLTENDTLFLNFDDFRVREMAQLTKARVVYFGESEGAELQAKEVKSDLSGTSFKLKVADKEELIKAPIFGRQMIYPLLAAIAVGLAENISIVKVKNSVKKLKPFKGRMNIIEGKKGSIIIDDTYNANPASVIEALNFLKKQSGRKIALLGNMNELGSFEREGHEMVGKEAAKIADILVTVGETAEKYLAKEAIENGMKKSAVKSFLTSVEAGDYVAKILKEGDVILAKGSQNKVRMEMAVERFMKNPEKKEDLLVRQSKFWKDSV